MQKLHKYVLGTRIGKQVLTPFFRLGFDSARYVFTDVTFGIHDRDRIIVVRESGGTLRSASWSERDRMNQTYFPTSGRKFKPSSIFDLENLKEVTLQLN